MEIKKTHLYGTIFLAAVSGIVICKLMGGKNSAFDGDEINSYADGNDSDINSYANGLGGTADTTQALNHNRPIHNEKDLRMLHGKMKHKVHANHPTRKHGSEVRKFWDAYHNANSPAHIQMARDWFEYKHPGAAEFTNEDALAYFKANGKPRVRMVQLGWAKRHGINDPKVAQGFWSRSLTSGDPAQMNALYHAFYPERSNSMAHSQPMPTGMVKGDPAFTTKNDVV